MLADAETDKPRDIRDRAILLLLAVYGMRSGEVAALRLDQVDWAGGRLWLFRLKRRQPQIYPLLPSVAEALARYGLDGAATAFVRRGENENCRAQGFTL